MQKVDYAPALVVLVTSVAEMLEMFGAQRSQGAHVATFNDYLQKFVLNAKNAQRLHPYFFFCARFP
jgi:hypothetical protein